VAHYPFAPQFMNNFMDFEQRISGPVLPRALHRQAKPELRYDRKSRQRV
jgi:hypothetical protein